MFSIRSHIQRTSAIRVAGKNSGGPGWPETRIARRAGQAPPGGGGAEKRPKTRKQSNGESRACPTTCRKSAAPGPRTPAQSRQMPLARGEGGYRENAKTTRSGKSHGNRRLTDNSPVKARPKLRVKRRPGAPRGNRNAWKTGLHTAGMKDLRRRLRAWRHRVRDVLAEVDDDLRAHAAAAAKPAEARESAIPQANLSLRPLPRRSVDVSE